MCLSNSVVSTSQQVELNDPTVYLWECDEQERVVLYYAGTVYQLSLYHKAGIDIQRTQDDMC